MCWAAERCITWRSAGQSIFRALIGRHKSNMSNEQKGKGKGYRLRGEVERPGAATLMTDDQVLECRRRHEYERWTPKRLADEYGVTLAYMRKLLDYATRSKLIPRRQT